MEIHILLAGEQIGPFSETQVRQYLGEGLVAPSDLAACRGMKNWQSLDHLLTHLPASEIASAAILPDVPPTEARSPAAPASHLPSTMQNNANPTLDLADRALSLTASQKMKRKLNKIVIQPILPLETTPPVPKKPRTGKTALTMEPLRPTTSLPPLTSLSREKKNGKNLIRTGQLSFGNLMEKAVVTTPAASTIPPVASPAPLNGSRPPPLPPPTPALPPAEISAAETSIRRIHPAVLYAGIAFLLILIGAALIFIYFLFAETGKPAEAPGLKPEMAAPAPGQTGIQNPDLIPKTAADYRDRGLADQAKGDLDGAIRDYNQALELDPKDGDTFYRRGLARQGKGDLNGALADYTQVITLNPKQADAFSNRGFVKQARGDLDGALADYTQALLVNPRISVAYYNEGLIEVQKGDLDGAIAAYNHALDLDPKMAIAYYNRGNAKNTEGNLDGAIADYTQALVLNPTIALAYCNRGFARQSKGDSDGALEDYAKALALNPKMAVALYNRGLIKVQKGDLAGAIADSSQAIDLDPKNGQAYCNRGLAQLGKGNLDAAMADLRQFCRLVPRDSGADSARLYLWLIATEENPKGTADQDLSASLQNDWNSSPEDLSSKIAAFLLGHINESDLIADAASPDPSREPGQYCKVWYFAGMKRLLAGDTAAAIGDFQKSVATRQKDYCEYIFAQSELQRLSLPISSKP